MLEADRNSQKLQKKQIITNKNDRMIDIKQKQIQTYLEVEAYKNTQKLQKKKKTIEKDRYK